MYETSSACEDKKIKNNNKNDDNKIVIIVRTIKPSACVYGVNSVRQSE